MWDPIISSGNLIKMNHADIKTIHRLRQRIKHSVKSIMKLDKEMRKKMKIEAGGGICFMAKNGASMRIADRGIADQYLNLCEEVIEKTIDQFKELDNLPWFDYDKIKDIDRKYKGHISKNSALLGPNTHEISHQWPVKANRFFLSAALLAFCSRFHADPPLRGIIRLHTGVPPSSKVAKYDSLECGTVPNRSSLSMVSVPIYRTIVR